MSRLSRYILFVVLLPVFGLSQTKNQQPAELKEKAGNTRVPFQKQPHSDAASAIEITDSIYGPTNVGQGFGALREYEPKPYPLSRDGRVLIIDPSERSIPVSLREENSAWFKLEFDHDTLLTFDLVPINPEDDYDFIFFKCADSSCIEHLKNGRKPDRECHSGFDSYNGATGISKHATTELVGSGPGPTYVKAIRVHAGEVYFLSVLYAEHYVAEGHTPKGFTLYFHDYWPKKKPTTLKNVQFKTNDATLLKESFAELDKLIELMKKEKAMAIEIRGHTDNQGSEEKNQDLSSRRAYAVRDYIVSKGIGPKRIQAKGFGSSKPIAPNTTETGRKKNRRVEFAMIMK